MNKFDVFYPVGPKDYDIIHHSIKNNSRKINGFDKIYIFNESKSTNIKGVEQIDPDFFPFSLDYIEDKIKLKKRAGWIYAQLVKLYYPYLQANHQHTLVVDADVFFLKKLNFIENNRGIFTVSDEYHQPYFDHMKKLHPTLLRNRNESGISHHMLFDKELLSNLFNLVEDYHQKKFYDVYLDEINPDENSPSGDYEIYFHYVLENFPKLYDVRRLYWENIDLLSKKNLGNKDFVSLPHYKLTRPHDFIGNLKKLKFKQAVWSLRNDFYIKKISV